MKPLDVASREYAAERKRLRDTGASEEDALEGARVVYRDAKVTVHGFNQKCSSEQCKWDVLGSWRFLGGFLGVPGCS